MSAEPSQPAPAENGLAHKLGPFDATLIVMGGIIGAGIFKNPAVVARLVPTPAMALGAWIIGGALALIGAFIYAELAVLRPRVGGQYAYLRDAYHPIVAFLYGWVLLLVIQTRGMAAVAIIFADYLRELTGIGLSSQVIAITTLAVLTAINCLGVRAGSNVQNALMLIKIAAIAGLIGVGLMVSPNGTAPGVVAAGRGGGWSGMTAAMVPVIFAYGGWQTASFLTGEMRNPRRDLPRGLVIGVLGVIALYLGVTFICIRALGIDGLAATKTPASEVMRQAMGATGAKLIAFGIAVSTAGFLSQSVLTAPRVYYAMARDGVFFKSVGRLDKRTKAPVVAIVLQSALAACIALWVDYSQILDYVVSIDVIFYGLTAASLFVFRSREKSTPADTGSSPVFRVPGHPVTTATFVFVCWAVSINSIWTSPKNAGGGVIILLIGFCVYWFWDRKAIPERSDLSG
jgi:APA family basic amino acid/polyamine antiporter